MKDTLSASNGPSEVTFETVNDVFSDFCNLTFTLVFESVTFGTTGCKTFRQLC